MRIIKGMLNSQFKSKSNTVTGIRKNRIYAGILSGLVLSLFWGTAAAQENNEWPCFHGLNRDNKSAETGLLKDWPEARMVSDPSAY